MQLVPVRTIEDIELALVRMQIAWKTGELRQLQRQLQPLEAAFSAFEQRVAAQSAHLTSERDRLRHICTELERYTARLHARLLADPTGETSAIFTPDELRDIGNLCGVDVPDDWFAKESRATTSGDEWYSTDETWFENSESHQESVTKQEADELRTLYRQLARTFHPDLTENHAERGFREEVMLRINHAWHVRDLNAMREIGNDVQDLLTGRMLSAVAYQLAWHRRELSRLDDECKSVRSRIQTMRASKTVALWHNAALANAAITRHVARIEQEIATLTSRHESVLEEFRLALGTYAAHR